jgi:hypothetical protein
MAEVMNISCGESESVASRGCCYQAIDHGQTVPVFFGLCLKCSPLVHLRLAKRNHAVDKRGKKFGFEPTPQLRPLPSFGKQQNAFTDFRYGDETDEQRKSRPGAQPCCGTHIRLRLCGLAQDVCIEEVIQNDTLRG